MFQEGLFAFLKNQSSITAILGTSRGDNSTGIFPVLAPPETTLPYITFMRISGYQPSTLQGGNALQIARFRFSLYGASQKQATQLAKALKDLFAGWTGTFSDGTVVQNVLYEFEMDDTESVPHGTIFASHVDYSFSYVEPS